MPKDDNDPDGCSVWAANNGYHKVSPREMVLIDAARTFAVTRRARYAKQDAGEPCRAEELAHGRALRVFMAIAESLDDDR